MLQLQAALAAKNISPSSTPVSTSDFLDALTSDFGAAPLLYCQQGGGQDYINEVSDEYVTSSCSLCCHHLLSPYFILNGGLARWQTHDSPHMSAA